MGLYLWRYIRNVAVCGIACHLADFISSCIFHACNTEFTIHYVPHISNLYLEPGTLDFLPLQMYANFVPRYKL